MHRFSRMMNPVILHNGTVRTMDPALPTSGALAIAGDRVVGGVGTRELALPSPERVDLGGRCVLPGFTGFRTSTSRPGPLAPPAAPARGLPLARGGSPTGCGRRTGRQGRGWLIGYGWRSGDWAVPAEPTRHDLDPLTGDVPVALWAKDDHSLWLNSAGLARANGDLAAAGGVVELDAHGEPSGLLREESAWRFRELHIAVSEDEYVDAVRAGIKVVHARGVTAIHDKDGWLGFARVWQRLRDRRGSRRPRVAVLPAPPSSIGSRSWGSGPAWATTSCGSATSRRSWTAPSARARR